MINGAVIALSNIVFESLSSVMLMGSRARCAESLAYSDLSGMKHVRGGSSRLEMQVQLPLQGLKSRLHER